MNKEKVIHFAISFGVMVAAVLVANKIQEQMNKASVAPPKATK